ncbi:MAG: pyridoxamine 5'-phosphate oxidase family protein [Nocardia sp.]|nr:pyridoxamine 5'-phosphate oxidase family protein [Nocardia sp.]
MNTTTTLDHRYSQPGATPTPWSTALATLEGAQLFWLTTIRAGGRPHITPLVAIWLDDAIYFATGEDEQKAHNLRGNPHVALTTGCTGGTAAWTSSSRAPRHRPPTRTSCSGSLTPGQPNGMASGGTELTTAACNARMKRRGERQERVVMRSCSASCPPKS